MSYTRTPAMLMSGEPRGVSPIPFNGRVMYENKYGAVRFLLDEPRPIKGLRIRDVPEHYLLSIDEIEQIALISDLRSAQPVICFDTSHPSYGRGAILIHLESSIVCLAKVEYLNYTFKKAAHELARKTPTPRSHER